MAQGISRPDEGRPRFAGPLGGRYRRRERERYARAVRPPPEALPTLARLVVAASWQEMPTRTTLGAFVACVHLQPGESTARLARRYGVSSSSVLRWLSRSGPTNTRAAAAVVAHAFEITYGGTMTRLLPAHVRAHLPLPANKAAQLVAQEVCAAYGVTLEELRAPSRRDGLVQVRRAVALKARRMGASVVAIADTINRSSPTVTHLLRQGGAK